MQLVDLLGLISVWSILLPLIIGITVIKRMDFDSKIIFMLVIIGMVPQILSNEIFKTTAFKNLTYNLYIPLEFSFYAILFNKKFILKKVKKIFYSSVFFFALISLYFILNYNITSIFLNDWISFSNLIQLIWAGIYLAQVYWVDEIEFNKREPIFWYLIAIICYTSCTTVYFSLWHVILSKSFEHFKFVRGIHHFFNICLYLLFAVGLLMNKKEKTV